MIVLGFFAKFKKSPASMAPLAGLTSEPSSDLSLPDIPPIDDMDLPPPPAYPKAAAPAPRPGIPNLPPSFDVAAPGGFEVSLEELTGKGQTTDVQSAPGESREEILKKIEHREEPQGPLYVKSDDYRGILEGAARIRDNLKEAADIILRMNELRNEEDKEFEKWRLQLEDIQRKLTYVDKIIFESS